MSRNPSDITAPFRCSGILPLVGKRLRLAQSLFTAVQAGFPNKAGIEGLTCIDADRAYFQREGDSTYYSVAITPAEADLLGYLPPPANSSAR